MAKISKRKILEALATEPLKPGRWHYNITANANETCEVCAVGAILRQLKWNFSEDEATILSSHGLIRTGTNSYLTELSKDFEAAADPYYGFDEDPNKEDLLRLHAMFHVEAFFPNILEVDIA